MGTRWPGRWASGAELPTSWRVAVTTASVGP